MKIKKANFKFLLTTFLVFSLFFINISSFEAKKTELECTYGTEDGNYKVVVEIYDNGEANAKYKRWNGADKNNSEDVGGFKNFSEEVNLNSLNWDHWIYKNQKCPQYLLAAHNRQFASVHFSHDGSNSYSDEDWNKYKKNLPLLTEASFSRVTNPRPVSSLYYKIVEDGSGTIDEVNKKAEDTKGTFAGQSVNYIYLKTTEKSVTKEPGYLQAADLRCTTDNTDIIKDFEVLWGLDDGKQYPNNTFARLYFKGDKAGTAYITCSYTNDSGSEVKKIFTVTVESSTFTSYEQKNLVCEYGAEYDGKFLTSIKVEVENYNDGYNSTPTIKYSYKNNNGNWTTATTGSSFTGYENYPTIQKKLFIYDLFSFALEDSKRCPNMYVGYDTAAWKEENHYYTITWSATTQNNKTLVTPEGESENVNNGCKVSVIFEEEVVGYVNFIMHTDESGKKTYSYVLLDGDGNEGIIGTTLADTKIIHSYRRTSIGTGRMKSKYSSKEYVFEKEFLEQLYASYQQTSETEASCQKPTNSCTRYQETETTGEYAITTHYTHTITTDETICGLSDGTVEEMTDEQVTVGDGLDPTDYGAGQTGELNLSAGDNSGDMTCDDFFGPEGSRNSLYDILHTLITVIRIGTPILLILLTMVDFTKATANDEALPKAKKNAVTRAIVAMIIFMLPSLVNLVLLLIGMESCMIN